MANGSTAANPTNIELTPMRVTWNGVDLGATAAGAQISIKTSKAPITADQYGKTDLDMRTNGQKITVTTELLETRDISKWAVVFPGASFISGASAALTIQLPIGRSDLANAQLLNLHPLVKPDSDATQDHNFYQAHPSEESSITYVPGGEAKLKLVWNIFPSITGGVVKFYKYGTIATGP